MLPQAYMEQFTFFLVDEAFAGGLAAAFAAGAFLVGAFFAAALALAGAVVLVTA
jgi:hypothetical protein